MYSIETLEEVEDDLLLLPKEVLVEALAYFDKYKTNPFQYSQPLENKGGRDLRGCRKTYIANATYRIILQVEKGVAKIVSIICVGERNNMDAYNTAHARLNLQK
ncbi:type II toxin-antitoxin system RelE family toxin [Sulfurospirillum barnesii]|uniref:Cytotoxic translational repressor of toxin-antitoxin stability system n=1 Tax=Sulfurospirillum barnesii (strain ATCC 700032 / DSM 10660 / SES-3) TaxID=760154 RepID=I3XTU0_SULBS|nr:hypothetical protein [Sulfurospirillum barnesii]AFL67364.1 hypothetical protein Sulba_0031 [Sulfurospirillum barnesii SES-3]